MSSKNSNKTDQEEASAADDMKKRTANRCFTILVSPPPNLPVEQDLINENVLSQDSEDSPTSSADLGKHLVARQYTNTSEDFLSPKTSPIHLDHTVSRLPSIEDMISDAELRKVLDSTPIHKEVQDLISTRDEKLKYDNILGLVKVSFENESWRQQAANDKALIDTLVLLCRQRLSVIQDPCVIPAGDFMVRHFKTLSKQTISRNLARRPSGKSVGSSAPVSSDFVDCSDEDAITRAATNLAILSVTIKLLRNICVESSVCQVYLHEHRIVDLLFDHLGFILDIVYLASNYKNIVFISKNKETLEWAKIETDSFARAFTQFVINVSSTNIVVKKHIFGYIYPDLFLTLCFFCGDFNLLFCLLNSLTCKCQTDVLVNKIKQKGYIPVYVLLAYATEVLYKNGRLKRVTSESNDPCEWGVIFFANILNHVYKENEHLFAFLLNEFFTAEISDYTNQVDGMLVKTTSPAIQSAVTSKVQNIVSTHMDWSNFSKCRVASLLSIPKQLILSVYFSCVDAALELCIQIYSIKPSEKSLNVAVDSEDTYSFGTTESELSNNTKLFNEGSATAKQLKVLESDSKTLTNNSKVSSVRSKPSTEISSSAFEELDTFQSNVSQYSETERKLLNDSEFNVEDISKITEAVESMDLRTEKVKKKLNQKFSHKNVAAMQLIQFEDNIKVLRTEFIRCLEDYMKNDVHSVHYGVLEPFSAVLVTLTCFASSVTESAFKHEKFAIPVLQAIFSFLKVKPTNLCMSNIFLIIANLTHKENRVKDVVQANNCVELILPYCKMNMNDILQREAAVYALRGVCELSSQLRTTLQDSLENEEPAIKGSLKNLVDF